MNKQVQQEHPISEPFPDFFPFRIVTGPLNPDSKITRTIDYTMEDIRRKPRETLPKIRELKKQYPDEPSPYNHLYSAFVQLKEDEKASEVLDEALERFPDYLFAKVNKAYEFLQEGKSDRAVDLIEGKFGLHLLYPERNQFHVTEVINFYSLVGHIHERKNRRDKAEEILEALKVINPKHPLTRKLEFRVDPSVWTLVTAIIQRVAGLFRR